MNTLNAFATFILIIGQLGHGEPVMVDTDGLTDVDSCPFVLRVSAKSRYAYYENSSRSPVVGARFGCIRKTDSAVLVVKKYELEKLDHPVRAGWSATFLAEDINSKAVPCIQVNSKLAVVFVEFSDGGTWQIANASKE